MGNIREERKKRRIEAIKSLILKGINDKEELVNILIVNFAITRRTALEEIEAVKYMEEVIKDGHEESKNENRGIEEESRSGDIFTG